MTAAPKYSLLECERRWLVAAAPDGLGPGRLIEDRYLDNARLRLRRETPAGGAPDRWKLARKYGATAPGIEAITNLYLTAEEHALLAALPGADLTKRRHAMWVGPERYVVDVFEGRLAGRMIAEIELADPSALWALTPPAWCGQEITGLPAFTGAALARAGWPE